MLDGRAMGGLVMTDPFHHYRRPVPRRIYGLFCLTWWAALLGGPLFCNLFFFLYWCYQNLFLLLSFLLVAFAVDGLW